MLLIVGALDPAPLSSAPRHRNVTDTLRACLSSAKGRTEPGRSACWAAADPNDPFTDCLNTPKGRDTYYGTMDCERAELDRTYFKLNRVQAALVRRLPRVRAHELKLEQKRWFAQRDKVCAREDLQADMLMCMIDKNGERTEQLERRLRRVSYRTAR